MVDRQSEKLMSAVAVQQAQLLNRRVPSDAELEGMEVSEAFEEKMQKLLAGEKRRCRGILRNRRFGKVIVLAAALAVLSLGAVMSVGANRAQFFQFFGRSFSISGEQNRPWSQSYNQELAGKYHNVYLPAWLPDGYKLATVEDSGKTFVINYTKGDALIRLVENRTTANVLIDAEVKGMERIQTGNQVYYFGEKQQAGKNFSQVIWQEENGSITLLANSDREEALKIAQNVKFKEN